MKAFTNPFLVAALSLSMTAGLSMSTAATAAVFDLGEISPVHLEPFNVEFSGNVDDVYHFSVASDFAFTSSVVSLGGEVTDLNTAFSFGSTPTNSRFGTAFQSVIVEDAVAAGSYRFTVDVDTSAAIANNQYFGNFTVAAVPTALSVAAVPEPEAYAMFLVGLCLLGFSSRRKA